ncbi:MAG: hypothetical protein ACK4M6_13350 [Hyphomonas sp.]
MQNEVKQEEEAEHRQNMTPTEVTQGRRVGLWKILAVSLVIVVVGFIVMALFTTPDGAGGMGGTSGQDVSTAPVTPQ